MYFNGHWTSWSMIVLCFMTYKTSHVLQWTLDKLSMIVLCFMTYKKSHVLQWTLDKLVYDCIMFYDIYACKDD